jgi:uncharacterized phiE125 gp8 family phage protein
MTLEGFPVTSIVSVTYVDQAFDLVTMHPASYYLDDYQSPASIINAAGTSWPATGAVANAVKVRYVVGSTAIHESIKAAILVLVAHLYFNRGDEINDPNYLGVPAVRALLQLQRVGMGV